MTSREPRFAVLMDEAEHATWRDLLTVVVEWTLFDPERWGAWCAELHRRGMQQQPERVAASRARAERWFGDGGLPDDVLVFHNEDSR